MANRTRQKQRHIDALDIAHTSLQQAVDSGVIATMAARRGYGEQEAQMIAKMVEKLARRLFKQALAIPLPPLEQGGEL
jgi:hypothetical protein